MSHTSSDPASSSVKRPKSKRPKFWRLKSAVLIGIAACLGVAVASQVAGGPVRLAQMGQLKIAEALQSSKRPPREIPDTAENFADRIGVVVHLVYADSGYANWPDVLGALRYLGVNRLREMAPLPTNARIDHVHAAADAGYKFDFLVMGHVPLDQSIASLVDFNKRHPGSIAAIEGPNEVNNFPVEYLGGKGDAAAQAFQADLAKAVHGNAGLRGIPVYNLTSWPDLAGQADAANFHSYPHGGAQAKATLLADMARQQSVMPGKPMVLTEAGYHNTIGFGLWEGVDEATAAPLLLNMLFDAWSAGIGDIYIYQLLDAYPDPGRKDMERHFGLFDINYRPKPAAMALRNLLVALRDRGSAGRTLTAATVGEGPDDLASMQLPRGDGARVVILYRRASLWDPAAHAPRSVAPAQVSVLPPTGARSVTISDPVAGSHVKQSLAAAKLTVSVGASPLVLAFSG